MHRASGILPQVGWVARLFCIFLVLLIHVERYGKTYEQHTGIPRAGNTGNDDGPWATYTGQNVVLNCNGGPLDPGWTTKRVRSPSMIAPYLRSHPRTCEKLPVPSCDYEYDVAAIPSTAIGRRVLYDLGGYFWNPARMRAQARSVCGVSLGTLFGTWRPQVPP